MDLTKLQEMGSADLVIDKDNLDTSASQVPYKISKWLKLLTEAKLQHVLADDQYKIVYRDRFHFYRLKYDIKLTDKQIIDIYLPADDEMQTARKGLKFAEETMRYIDGVIKSLHNINFNISNMIKWKEYQHGR